jgi:hypothetical protein
VTVGKLPKVAILGLVLILLLFVVSLVVTADGTGERVELDDNWLTRLAGGFAEKRPLDPGELQGACVSGAAFILQPGASCSVTIAKADAAVRTLTITRASGIELGLDLVPADPRSLSVQLTLDSNMPTVSNLTVGREGGQLFLACASTLNLPCTAGLG